MNYFIYSSRLDTLVFLTGGFRMKPLFSPKHGDKWKKYNRNYLFPQNANFLITDEKELIKVSHSHGAPLSFPAVVFVVYNKTIQNYHRFPWYATLENKTPAETFSKFPSVIRVIDRSDPNPPITATSVTFWPSLRHASGLWLVDFDPICR